MRFSVRCLTLLAAAVASLVIGAPEKASVEPIPPPELRACRPRPQAFVGEVAEVAFKAEANCAAQSSFACPTIVPDAEPPRLAMPVVASRQRNALCRAALAQISAPAPAKGFCVEPPKWSVGIRMPDLAIDDLARIDPYIHAFAEGENGRKLVRNWLVRSGKHRMTVARALREQGLPRDLDALVFMESGFSPTAVSHAGAVGLWQLMEKTARDYGLVIDAEYDERRSVIRSSEVGAQHLSDLFQRFGSWELALAGYNLGAKTLARRMEEFGVNDFWSLAAIKGALPRETVEYVPKILAMAVILRNLEHFHFDDVRVSPAQFTNHLDVPSGTSFALIARASATSVEYLRELNPEILSAAVPNRGRIFAVNVPSAGLARARVMLPHLLAKEGDHPEDGVPHNFDWGSDELEDSPARVAELVAPTAPKAGGTPVPQKSAAPTAPKPPPVVPKTSSLWLIEGKDSVGGIGEAGRQLSMTSPPANAGASSAKAPKASKSPIPEKRAKPEKN